MVNRYQQGMALMMALVMMAIAISLAVGIWYSSRLAVARTMNMQAHLQAQHLSQGLLLWAGDILEKDVIESNPAYDDNNESWQQGIRGLVVEQAVLSGELTGMNHLFNLNNLVINHQDSTEHAAYFRRLLNALNLDLSLADKIMDWIDSDQEQRPGGAEDFVYAAARPPYQTADSGFRHIDELRLIAGIDESLFNQLAPYVTVLPVQQGSTLMNINTLPPVMIKALNPAISEELAVRIYQQGQASFSRLEDFFTFDDMAYISTGEEVKPVISQLIGVQTNFLQARSEVAIEDRRYQQYALMYRRTDGATQVLMRSPIPFLPEDLLH